MRNDLDRYEMELRIKRMIQFNLSVTVDECRSQIYVLSIIFGKHWTLRSMHESIDSNSQAETLPTPSRYMSTGQTMVSLCGLRRRF
jgi:hypothetical protein